jgi:carbon starvation protein
LDIAFMRDSSPRGSWLSTTRRATPAERLRDGHDFEPTNKWIVFGHHFAAIAGPGPLVGPTLAAQFGYLPGFLWIVIGAVLGDACRIS